MTSLAGRSIISKKVFWAVVGLEIIDGFSTGLRYSSLKRSLSRRLLFGAVVAVNHVNDVFGVTVNVISDRSGFACSVECV